MTFVRVFVYIHTYIHTHTHTQTHTHTHTHVCVHTITRACSKEYEWAIELSRLWLLAYCPCCLQVEVVLQKMREKACRSLGGDLPPWVACDSFRPLPFKKIPARRYGLDGPLAPGAGSVSRKHKEKDARLAQDNAGGDTGRGGITGAVASAPGTVTASPDAAGSLAGPGPNGVLGKLREALQVRCSEMKRRACVFVCASACDVRAGVHMLKCRNVEALRRH